MKKLVVPNDELIPEIERLVESGTDVVFTPKGMSMLPFIRGDRDSVLLKKVTEVGVGDIVLARLSGGNFVLHRIVALDDDKVILMGDGNIAGKESCMKKDLLAVAVKIMKGGKVIDCFSRSHRRRSRIWNSLLPFRRYLLAIYRRIIL